MPVEVRVLRDLDQFDTRLGRLVISAVELIVAGIALEAGLFTVPQPPPLIVEYMFSSIVIVAVVTTLAVPVLLRPMIGPPAED